MMYGKVLMLDSTMAPVRTISWKRAMTLWFQQKVRVLEEQAMKIRGDSWEFRIPSVVQLKSYVMKRSDKHVRFNRKNVFYRDDYTCQYCQFRFQPQKLTLEHVLPRCRGGRTDWLNIVTSCLPCNQKKEGRTPDEAGMPLRRKPNRPQGMDFFVFAMPEEVPQTWEPYVGWLKPRRKVA